MAFLGIAAILVGCLVAEIFVVGISMELMRWLKRAPDPGLPFLCLVPMLAVAGVACKDPKPGKEPLLLFVGIFVCNAILCIAYMSTHWLAIGGALALFAAFYGKGFVAGLHYMFVPHAAEPIISGALDRGVAINTAKLADALTPDIGELETPHSKMYYEHQTLKARKLKEKLDADAAIAEATIARERKRAELEEAEHALREIKRRK
jgi:hypothetical protein